MAQDHVVPAGTFIIFDHGEYSDYSYTGPFRVLKDIDKYREAQAYRDQWKAPNEWTDDPDPHDFIVWLLKEGFISDEEVTAWHIGSYGRFEP